MVKGYLTTRRSSGPAQVIGTKTQWISGNPDPSKINTSYAERQNLTMRMQMRRFTRLTNAFSKRIENHSHALALYFVWYHDPGSARTFSELIWVTRDACPLGQRTINRAAWPR
jgi:hypothetical protein